MAGATFLARLSRTQAMELNDEVRSRRYGQHQALIAWMSERGFNVSKSAMARYAQALKRSDGVIGKAGSHLVAAAMPIRATDTLEGLFQRLGELEYERSIVLERIREKLAEQDGKGAQ